MVASWYRDKRLFDFKLVPTYSLLGGNAWHCYSFGHKSLSFIYLEADTDFQRQTMLDKIKEFFGLSDALQSRWLRLALHVRHRLQGHDTALSYLHSLSLSPVLSPLSGAMICISLFSPFVPSSKEGSDADHPSGFLYFDSESLCDCIESHSQAACCFLDALQHFDRSTHLQLEGPLIALFRLGGECSLASRESLLRSLPLRVARILVINEFHVPLFNFIPKQPLPPLPSQDSDAIPMSLISNRDGRDLIASMDWTLFQSDATCSRRFFFASNLHANMSVLCGSGLPPAPLVNSTVYLRELLRLDYRIEVQRSSPSSSLPMALVSALHVNEPEQQAALEPLSTQFQVALNVFLTRDPPSTKPAPLSPPPYLTLPPASHAVSIAADLMIPIAFDADTIAQYNTYLVEKMAFGDSTVSNIDTVAAHPTLFYYLHWLIDREAALKCDPAVPT
jgi:hypothetical protein